MKTTRSSVRRRFISTIARWRATPSNDSEPVSSSREQRPVGARKPQMTLFTVEELREVVGARVLAGEGIGRAKHSIRRIGLDTRSLRPGDLFLALRGDRFDGHDFVATALSRGAVGAIV